MLKPRIRILICNSFNGDADVKIFEQALASVTMKQLLANPHLKLQIALTWTIDAITLLKNTIWLDTSALLDLDSTMMSDLFLSPKLQIPHRF